MEDTLKLYNTMSRQEEVFKVRQEGAVRMFTCGPSVYRRPHVGNYRTFLWEDVLQRYLNYLGYRVERVINLTDVEDKAIWEAERHGTNVRELTEGVVDRFLQEVRDLRIDLPDNIPRSSTCVDQAVNLIKILLEKGYAYRHEGDIFFDPLKYEGFGRLYGLDMTRWPKTRRHFKRDTYPGRRWNLGDFILWHGSKDAQEPLWDTELGRGRPAWNIQDPAIITKHLGYSVDVCCGGIDNLYRHHDYNLAVTEAASGVELSRFWVHGEHLLSNGKKMSKSLGNIVYLEDLIGGGYTADHVRFFLIYGQHRKRMNLTTARFRQAAAKMDVLRKLVEPFGEGSVPAEELELESSQAGRLLHDFTRHMNGDLDVKGAVDGLLHNLKRMEASRGSGQPGETERKQIAAVLARMDSVLQVLYPSPR
jgi:cysteinyl-tRNA synthetase